MRVDFKENGEPFPKIRLTQKVFGEVEKAKILRYRALKKSTSLHLQEQLSCYRELDYSADLNYPDKTK